MSTFNLWLAVTGIIGICLICWLKRLLDKSSLSAKRIRQEMTILEEQKMQLRQASYWLEKWQRDHPFGPCTISERLELEDLVENVIGLEMLVAYHNDGAEFSKRWSVLLLE